MNYYALGSKQLIYDVQKNLNCKIKTKNHLKSTDEFDEMQLYSVQYAHLFFHFRLHIIMTTS